MKFLSDAKWSLTGIFCAFVVNRFWTYEDALLNFYTHEVIYKKAQVYGILARLGHAKRTLAAPRLSLVAGLLTKFHLN